MLDNGFDIDIDAINENVAEAEVVTFYFPMLRRTLLVDTRLLPSEGPLVAIVPMARSSAERFESLEQLRPALPRPRSITMIPWTRRIQSLCRAGVWDGLQSRLLAVGGVKSVQAANECLGELRWAEQTELAHAITGVGYRTVWGSAGAGDRRR